MKTVRTKFNEKKGSVGRSKLENSSLKSFKAFESWRLSQMNSKKTVNHNLSKPLPVTKRKCSMNSMHKGRFTINSFNKI